MGLWARIENGAGRRFGLLAGIWALILLVCLGAGFGIARMNFDDGLSKVFASDTQRYRDYRAYLGQYDTGDGDLLAVFTAADFTDDAAFQAVRDFVFEVQFEPGVIGLISPFSFDIPDSENRAAAMDTLWQENTAFRRFLSEDRQVLLVSLMVETQGAEAAKPLYQRLDRLVDALAIPAGVEVEITGYPVLRDGIVAALFDDFVLLILVGAAIGTLVSAVALRGLGLAMMSAGTSLVALVWMLGLFGLVGISINVVTVSLPVLILVLSFASTIHLTFETRRLTIAGEQTPVQTAVRRIGPACALTSVTTAAAFASLMTSPSELISEMGLAGALATLVSLVAVFTMHPAMLVSLSMWRGLGQVFRGNRGTAAKGWYFDRLTSIAARRPWLVAIAGVVLLAASSATYLQVKPTYSLYDNVEFDGPAFQALDVIEHKLAPVGSIVFPTDLSLDQDGAMEQLRAAEAVMRKHASPLQVVSLASFGDEGGVDLPDHLRARLVSEQGAHPVILVLVPNTDGAEIRKFVSGLTARLEADPDLQTGLLQPPTGLLVASSYLAYDMLLDLNRCFLVAVIASALVVMVWLRNPILGLVALVPNVLPVALVGAWLTLSERGLEFSSGIALTIAFGLAIDDTVHVLNRIRLNAGPDGDLSRDLILRSVRQTAPALVITSVVLSLGLLGTQWGQLQSVAYFGGLSIAAFILALIADLLILPACLIAVHSVVPGKLLRIRSW